MWSRDGCQSGKEPHLLGNAYNIVLKSNSEFVTLLEYVFDGRIDTTPNKGVGLNYIFKMQYNCGDK